jgi:hypothetical protein
MPLMPSQIALRTLEVPSSLRSKLDPNQLQALDHLCTSHNVLQADLIKTEKRRQQLIQDALSYEPDIAEAILYLNDLRHHVAECVRLGFGGVAT